MDSKIHDAVDSISMALRRLPENNIKGATLGELIRDLAPSLNIREVMNVPRGPGALSKFIEKHLSSVLTKNGTSGSDLVYRINKDPNHVPDTAHELWLAFARPTSEKLVALDLTRGPDDATVSVVDTINPDQFKIERTTHAELDAIRGDFTSLVNKGILQEEAHLDASAQYSEWSKKLKSIGPEHYSKWSRHRVDEIVKLFGERLHKFGVSPTAVEKLKRQLSLSQSANHRLANGNYRSTKSEDNALRAPEASTFNVELLRQALIKSIEVMDYSELRKIKLRAGALFDAVSSLVANGKRDLS